ncbi:murein L,D-transpeptidase family protein [Sphingomonas sp. ac-8]|uniref:L,D-transpeptidase family protein n=1 Tax=Sphingomonas sp. ac-8 TaxID=3242977 RepID=UPI003A7FA031
MKSRRIVRALVLAGVLVVGAIGYTLVMARIGSGTAPAMAPAERQADRILVSKADRRLHLLRSGVPIRTYRIVMGANWDQGAKRQEGDERTPEGRYVIDWRNPRSSAHLSLHISYPDAGDRAAAQRRNVAPGGDIMIHGLPNGWGLLAPIHRLHNWTDGCIGVTNAEMEEIWSLVPTGTPIAIRAGSLRG